MTLTTPLIGLTLITISGSLHFWRKKKAFDNPRYPSYWRHLSAKTLDKLYNFLSLISLIGGILMIATAYQDTWGGFVLLPIYAVMLFLLIGV